MLGHRIEVRAIEIHGDRPLVSCAHRAARFGTAQGVRRERSLVCDLALRIDTFEDAPEFVISKAVLP
jgi:hypothetical protein